MNFLKVCNFLRLIANAHFFINAITALELDSECTQKAHVQIIQVENSQVSDFECSHQSKRKTDYWITKNGTEKSENCAWREECLTDVSAGFCTLYAPILSPKCPAKKKVIEKINGIRKTKNGKVLYKCCAVCSLECRSDELIACKTDRMEINVKKHYFISKLKVSKYENATKKNTNKQLLKSSQKTFLEKYVSKKELEDRRSKIENTENSKPTWGITVGNRGRCKTSDMLKLEATVCSHCLGFYVHAQKALVIAPPPPPENGKICDSAVQCLTGESVCTDSHPVIDFYTSYCFDPCASDADCEGSTHCEAGVCTCIAAYGSCSSDADCCSNRCSGRCATRLNTDPCVVDIECEEAYDVNGNFIIKAQCNTDTGFCEMP